MFKPRLERIGMQTALDSRHDICKDLEAREDIAYYIRDTNGRVKTGQKREMWLGRVKL